MSLMLDVLIAMAVTSVILTQVLTNFNRIIKLQTGRDLALVLFEQKVAVKELIRKDLALAFNPLPSLEKANKLLDASNLAKDDKDKTPDSKDKSSTPTKTDKPDPTKLISDKEKEKKKIPAPFYVTFHEEKYKSKIFKSSKNLVKMFSFVSANSVLLPSYEPCRVTYYFDQFSGKHNAQQDVLFKLYRMETSDLRTVPTLKAVKAHGSLILDNVMEASFETCAPAKFFVKFPPEQKVKKTTSLKELFENDSQDAKDKEKDKTKEAQTDKPETKDSTNKDADKKDTPETKDASKKNGEIDVFPQNFFLKIAYKEQGKPEPQKLELTLQSITSGLIAKAPADPDKDKAPATKDGAPKPPDKTDPKAVDPAQKAATDTKVAVSQ